MKLRIALACALAIIASAGCTKISTQTSSPNAANPWTIHGVLRVAAEDEPDNLDPLVGNQQAEVDLSLLWGAYLFRVDDRNAWVPELATRVPTLQNGDISRDGLRVTYHLRPGVRWQDGAPFGADDVIYTWQQVMNPANNVTSRVGYDDITRIDKLDDHTIAVHLRTPYAPFLSAFFSMGGTPFCILPRHLLAQYPDINHVAYNHQPIGTGPFILASYTPGSMVRFVANPTYFRGPPKLKEIDWHFIPDGNTIITQLETHEIDAVFALPYAYYPSAKLIRGVRIYLTPLTAYDQVQLNLSHPILADLAVRKALAYGVDRQTIADKAYHGVLTVGSSDQPPFSWAYNPHVQSYDYDPARAAQLLDADGWKLAPDGFRYKNGQRLAIEYVTTPGGNGADNVIIQQDWRKIGVDTTVKIVAGPLYFATYGGGGIVQTGKFDAAYLGWFNGVDPDDSTQFMCDQFPPQGQNTYHFCDPALDAQERIALGSFDIPTRKAAYDKIQEILAAQVPTIFMFAVRRVSVLNSDFRNYKPSHAVSTLWNPWEWDI
ncbi:MAG TPA: peptide ABC transporter substrate-binding protein [Candidatus Acidoferrales bacterium]|nr:peptide ABC transporter substrate-binding protein [Candidatus Acidoferrales bacterium]